MAEGCASGHTRIVQLDGRTGLNARQVAVFPAGNDPGLTGIDYDRAGRHLILQGQADAAYSVAADGTVIATRVESASW